MLSWSHTCLVESYSCIWDRQVLTTTKSLPMIAVPPHFSAAQVHHHLAPVDNAIRAVFHDLPQMRLTTVGRGILILDHPQMGFSLRKSRFFRNREISFGIFFTRGRFCQAQSFLPPPFGNGFLITLVELSNALGVATFFLQGKEHRLRAFRTQVVLTTKCGCVFETFHL